MGWNERPYILPVLVSYAAVTNDLLRRVELGIADADTQTLVVLLWKEEDNG